MLRAQIAHFESQLSAEQARREEVEKERDRLRERTKEIQCQEMMKRAALDSQVDRFRAAFKRAREWTERKNLVADWALDPLSPFWPMTSTVNREALAALIEERDAALHALALEQEKGQRLEALLQERKE